MIKITKKIPLLYQRAIQVFYGRKRMSRLCKTYKINYFSLLRYLETCCKEGLRVNSLKVDKVIPKWVENNNKLVVVYKTIPKVYQHVITRHFSFRKAKQVSSAYDISLSLFVRLLESCYYQKVCLWDLAYSTVEIFPIEVPLRVLLNETNILCPVFEFS
jgi:hypothetical protein